MSKNNINPNRAPLRSLLADFQDLGLVDPMSSGLPGVEHVLREDTHLDGGNLGLRARTGDDYMDVYEWKPNVRQKVIVMSKEEALKLAALIHKTYPLDALGSV